MNAARILARAGVDSGELRAVLAPVRPEDVSIWPAGAGMRRTWRPGIRAITIGRWVFVDPSLMREDSERLARLVVHELVHVRQFARAGWVPFMTRYLREYWLARRRGDDRGDAYDGITSEVEAREVVDRFFQPGSV